MTGTPEQTPPKAGETRLDRVLAGKTRAHRTIKSLGALATALLAIGALFGAVRTWIAPGDAPPPGTVATAGQTARSPSISTVDESGSTIVRMCSAEADDLVRLLLRSASTGPVALDHKIYAPNTNPEYSLAYACEGTTNAVVRIEPGDVPFPTYKSTALWLKGCFRVVVKGNEYAASDLALEMFSAVTCTPK